MEIIWLVRVLAAACFLSCAVITDGAKARRIMALGIGLEALTILP